MGLRSGMRATTHLPIAIMNELKKQVMKLIETQQGVDDQAAYNAGLDCANNGPNDDNCHFRFFSRPSLTQAWQRGKAAQKIEKWE